MFSKIRRRWRRFRYNNQATYPGFFRLFDFLKFPAQVALLTITVWSVVGWYINYTAIKPAQYVHSDTALQKPGSDSPTPAIVAKDHTTPATTNQISTINPITIEPVAIAPIVVSPSNSVVKINRNEKTDPDSAKQLSAAESSPTLSTSTADRRANIVDEKWVLAQKAGFVVQISSSAQSGKIRELAEQLTELEPVVIYPSKVSASGQRIYGLSVGYYPTYMLAAKSFGDLPKELQSVKPWIRSISEIQKAIKSVQNLQDTTIVNAKQ